MASAQCQVLEHLEQSGHLAYLDICVIWDIFGPFWATLDYFGPFKTFRAILDHFGLLWTIWTTLDNFGPFVTFWKILDHFGPLWNPLDILIHPNTS